MKKVLGWSLAIVSICAIGLYIILNMPNEKEPIDVDINNKQSQLQVDEKKENTNENKEIEEEQQLEEPEELSKEDENTEEALLSSEEKAKKIVKEKWGTSAGVYFNIDEVKGSGEYVVSVREAATTKALVWYKVNVNTGEVTDY